MMPTPYDSQSGLMEPCVTVLGAIMRDLDALAEQQQVVTQEMERITKRLDAALDFDLQLSRENDREGVLDLVATAHHDLAGDTSTAQTLIAALQQVALVLSGAIRLHEVHKANDKITVRKTARQVKASRPALASETEAVQSWINDQPSASGNGAAL